MMRRTTLFLCLISTSALAQQAPSVEINPRALEALRPAAPQIQPWQQPQQAVQQPAPAPQPQQKSWMDYVPDMPETPSWLKTGEVNITPDNSPGYVESKRQKENAASMPWTAAPQQQQAAPVEQPPAPVEYAAPPADTSLPPPPPLPPSAPAVNAWQPPEQPPAAQYAAPTKGGEVELLGQMSEPVAPPPPAFSHAKQKAEVPPPPPPPAVKKQTKPVELASLPPAPQPMAAAPAPGTMTLPFGTNDTALNDPMKNALSVLAADALAHPNTQVQITAHASGNEQQATMARRISLARALAVRAFLIDQGIDNLRILVQAEGNKNPANLPDRVDVVLR